MYNIKLYTIYGVRIYWFYYYEFSENKSIRVLILIKNNMSQHIGYL